MTNRLHQRIARPTEACLHETLDEIHEDYFAGRLTSTQYAAYKQEAFHDYGKVLFELEAISCG